MGLDKKAMFEKLLEQIKWQDDREAFSDALIEKVEVHTKSKRWDFYLETNDILPFQTFANLISLSRRLLSRFARRDCILRREIL